MLVRMKVHAKIDRCLFIWYLETGSKCPLSDISHTSDKLLSMKPLLYKCERSNVFLTTKRIVFVCGLSPSLLWSTPSLSLSLSFSLSLSDTQSLSNTHNWWECELNFLESSNWIQYRNIKDWKKTFPFSLDWVAVVVVSDSKNSLQMVPSKLVPNKIILIKIIYLPSRT